MHIKDHSAAMKFFRTYDNVASKGKWKEFVKEMEFDSMLREPRPMAHGGRPGYQGGQLVDHGPGRQGYAGDDTAVDTITRRYKYDDSIKEKLNTLYDDIKKYEKINNFRTPDAAKISRDKIKTRLNTFASEFKEITGRLPVANEIRAFGVASQAVTSSKKGTYLIEGKNFMVETDDMLKTKWRTREVPEIQTNIIKASKSEKYLKPDGTPNIKRLAKDFYPDRELADARKQIRITLERETDYVPKANVPGEITSAKQAKKNALEAIKIAQKKAGIPTTKQASQVIDKILSQNEIYQNMSVEDIAKDKDFLKRLRVQIDPATGAVDFNGYTKLDVNKKTIMNDLELAQHAKDRSIRYELFTPDHITPKATKMQNVGYPINLQATTYMENSQLTNGRTYLKKNPDGNWKPIDNYLSSKNLTIRGPEFKQKYGFKLPIKFNPETGTSNIVELSFKKTVPKIVKQTELVSFPANFKDVKWGKNLKGARGGTLFEVLFGTLDYWNEKSKGKEGGWGSQSMATAIQNASFGLLKTGDKKYEHELIKLGKEMGFDTTALEHVIDMNKRDNVLAKVESSHASHLEAIKKKMDETTDPEMKEKLQEIYNERKMRFATEERLRMEDTQKIFDTFVEDLRATKAGPPQLVSPEKLAATGITQEEADAPFKNIWTTAQEQLKREKTKAFPEASKRLDYEAGVIGDPLQTHIFNKDAWKKEHEAFGYWNKTPKQEERAYLDSLIKLAEEGNPEPLKEYNLRERGVTQDQPVTRQSVKNLTEQYPWLGYRIKEAKGGRVPFGKGKLVDKGRRAFMKWLAGITGAGIAAGTGLIKFGKFAGKGKTVIRAGDHIIQGTPGMPDWYIPLINRIVREGTDVTKKLGTVEREIVHTKKISKTEDVTVYRNTDTGNVRVEYGPSLLDDQGKVIRASNDSEVVHLEYRAGEVIEEGKMAGKKTKSEFSAAEAKPRVTNWEGDIEWEHMDIDKNVDDLLTPTHKLKTFAKKKLTHKDKVIAKKKQKYKTKLEEDPSEQLEYVQKKEGMTIDDFIDEGARVGEFEARSGTKGINLPDKIKKASGGRVSYFDGGIVSLKKKW